MVIRVACAWRILNAVPQCIHEQKIQSTTLFNPSHITHAWTGCPVLELHTTSIKFQSTPRNLRAHWGAKLVRSPRTQWPPGALDALVFSIFQSPLIYTHSLLLMLSVLHEKHPASVCALVFTLSFIFIMNQGENTVTVFYPVSVSHRISPRVRRLVGIEEAQ